MVAPRDMRKPIGYWCDVTRTKYLRVAFVQTLVYFPFLIEIASK